MPTPTRWIAALDAFRPSRPEPLLDVRVTAFGDEPWHVYAFADGASADGTVQATVRGQPGPWVPVTATVQTSAGPVTVEHESMGGQSSTTAVQLPLGLPLGQSCA
jgi:hypothetical protein